MIKGIYLHKEIKAGLTIDVQESYPGRYGKNLTREGRTGKGTPLAMQKYNDKLKHRELTRILNENFKEDDYHLVLTYSKDKRPAAEQGKLNVANFTRKLKRLYKKEGVELKAVKIHSFGSKGAIHHHLVISGGVEDKKISALWNHSEKKPSFHPLYNTGDYSGLAYYLLQQAKIGLNENEFITGTAWSCTRNCKKPIPEPPKIINKVSWKEPPMPKKGYYIDLDSIDAGINEYNGKPYLFYRMIKIPHNATVTTPDGRLLKNDEAARFIHKANRERLRADFDKYAPLGKIIKKDERQNE